MDILVAPSDRTVRIFDCLIAFLPKFFLLRSVIGFDSCQAPRAGFAIAPRDTRTMRPNARESILSAMVGFPVRSCTFRFTTPVADCGRATGRNAIGSHGPERFDSRDTRTIAPGNARESILSATVGIPVLYATIRDDGP